MALILVSMALSCGSDVVDQSQYTLRQAGFRVLYMAPVYVAMEKGIFQKEGIDFSYTEIDSGALGVATVISGDVDISDIDPMNVARLRERGQSLIMFYNIVNRVTMDLIVRNEILQKAGVNRASSLETRYRVLDGLNIGVTRPGAATDVFARYFLIRAGLNPDRDVNLIQVGGVSSLDATFRSGRIDAFLLSPPLPQTLEQAGLGQIIIRNTAGEVPELRRITMVNFFTSSSFAEANRPALEAYSRAITKATRWIRENREATLRILGEKFFPNTAPESLALSLDAILPTLNDDGRFTEEQVQGYFDVFETIGESVTADPSEGVLWTNELIP